ncbi:hypothetical protein niasHT_028186 [Heterodera trifolii]|uniref:Uncharacterized protein n=1 Tax=Heterodera trifolii TaxID=157864 RepID=A0ABD2JNX7_9BILA
MECENSFTFPLIFAEDIVGLLGRVPPPNLAPLIRLTEMDSHRLELCTDDAHFRQAMEQMGGTLMGYFRNNAFKIWYPWHPCPISISNANCILLLNDTKGAVHDIQQLIASSSYRQSTLELALTLNRNGGEQKKSGECLERKMEMARQLLEGNNSINWPVVAKPPKGRQSNEWMERFAKFLAQNSGARLLEDFMSSNMALLTVNYRGTTFQRIVYRDDYTLWELLSDVGGVLGLYFGLTIIAVYELVVFALLVDRKNARK